MMDDFGSNCTSSWPLLTLNFPHEFLMMTCGSNCTSSRSMITLNF